MTCTRNVPSFACCLLHAVLLGLLSSSEDGDDIFLRNVGGISTDYTASYPRR
jgi:Na+/glutamate symporter